MIYIFLESGSPNAYIPPESKPACIGGNVGEHFALPTPTTWYLKTLAHPMQILNIASQ